MQNYPYSPAYQIPQIKIQKKIWSEEYDNYDNIVIMKIMVG